ncbi:peptidyl-prolyl cis-trans isomerase FKBP17-1, chloroplastic isoform X1 [Diospyros lotus]|uniref:peptidyl-prolyl cis-trans isomerase FKBP17-1, chloroplastic isoform X1 n=1 Tax=Diospyros lotus TaxID=55363 RepID=UPI002257A0B7|nr:peptidyl-prolyl cis-trans isomerase FKBP17-1, chloroplastic isoform X1 [Diospyros lotus]XP_052172410.1 peptidyl-prolyl cis-trans isomerase FKBP17-1, chloroplastic isoform X1 [Diospyros lotus]
MKGQCSSGCSLSVSSRLSFLPFRSQTLDLTLARNIEVSAASSSPKLSLPSPWTSRRAALVATFSAISSSAFSNSPFWSKPLLLLLPEFFELPNSGGVKALDLRLGDGELPIDGDQVAIHYYGRLAAKQGWRFDSTYDHKDETGEPIPFTFILGSGKVIQGVEAAVRSMKVHGQRRVIIPPSQGYQNTSQEPIPPNFFDRQRLFTTIFNPTRLANGEGSTLGTLIFDIELVSLRHQ